VFLDAIKTATTMPTMAPIRRRPINRDKSMYPNEHEQGKFLLKYLGERKITSIPHVKQTIFTCVSLTFLFHPILSDVHF
jgi:hypothetical protein